MPDNALPRSFEDFNEARKLGFLAAKEYKERGGKLAGCLCSYTPLEVIDAAGMAAIGLCGMSDEAIPDAETVLPKNLCPLIKGTYGFALTEKCPYTYFSDIIVGETTCDGKKKMYELLADLKDVHVLHLPQSQARSYAADIWHEEVKLFASELERRFGVRIDDGKLRDAARLRNRYRRALVRLYELQRSEPPAMRGVELMSTLLASTFSFDVETFVGKLEALADERERAYAAGERPVAATAKRILLTGCPSGGVINKVGKVIEEHGGVIVCLDDCSGERANRLLVDEDADDILRAISDRYLAPTAPTAWWRWRCKPATRSTWNRPVCSGAWRKRASRTSSWKPTTLQGTAARWEPGWPRSSRCCSDCRLVGANGDPWQFLERIPLRFLA